MKVLLTRATPTLQNTPDRWIYEGYNVIICNIKGFILFTRLNNKDKHVTLTFDPWPCKSIGVVLLSEVVCVPSLTVLAETVQSVSCLQGLTTMLSMWPWPLTPTLKINRVHPLVISSMCTKYDGPSWNGSVCIVFTMFYNNV